MEIIAQPLEGLFLIKPRLFSDERGYFFESFQKEKYADIIGDINFVQDNQSLSQKNVLRGLHYQKAPFEQAKLVRVVQGAAIDVAVDIRKNSKSYGQHLMVELSAENNYQFWIPIGFAHGFLSLEDNTILQYKCSNYYSKDHDAAIRWDDKDLNINWGIQDPIMSEKDKNAAFFSEL